MFQFATRQVIADDYYWVGGSGSWSELDHWATSSGGSTMHFTVPTAIDDVFFDSNSFLQPNQVVTIDLAGSGLQAACKNMNWIGVTNSPTLTGNSLNILRIFGSLTLSANMNNDFLGDIKLESGQLANQVQTNGVPIKGNLIFSGDGGWNLTDNIVCQKKFIHQRGSLNLLDIILTCHQGYDSQGIETRSILLNHSRLAIYGGMIITTDNLTLSADNSTITIYGADIGSRIQGTNSVSFNNLTFSNTNTSCSNIININYIEFNTTISAHKLILDNGYVYLSGMGSTYPVLSCDSLIMTGPCGKRINQWMTLQVESMIGMPEMGLLELSINSDDQIRRIILNNEATVINGEGSIFDYAWINSNTTINGGFVFDTLLLCEGRSYTLLSGSEQNIIDTLGLTGTCTSIISLQSTTSGVTAALKKLGGNVKGSYLQIKDIESKGGALFIANNTIDLGNNPGWIIQSPPLRVLYWVGGEGNWNDVNHWAISSGGTGGECLPTVFDDVIFDINSFTTNNQIVTINISHAVCRTMDWSSVDKNPILAGIATNTLQIFGSLYLASHMSNQFNGELSFESNQSGNVIVSNGQPIKGVIYFRGLGSWTIHDNMYCIKSFNHLSGSIILNNILLTINAGFYAGTMSPRELLTNESTVRINAGGTVINTSNYYLEATASSWYIAGQNELSEIYGTNSVIFKKVIFINTFGGNFPDYGVHYLNLSANLTFHHLGLDGGNIKVIPNSISSTIIADSLFLSGWGNKQFGQNAAFLIHYIHSTSQVPYLLIKAESDDHIDRLFLNGITTDLEGGGTSFELLNLNTDTRFLSSFSIDSLQLTAGKSYQINSGQTLSINNELFANGSCSQTIIINSLTEGSAAYLRKSGSQITVNYCDLKDIHVTGGALFTANNTIDRGNNLGWQINPPVYGTHYWIGGVGNWSDMNHWALSSGGAPGACPPTAFDDVIFDNNSFSSSNETVTIDITNASCKNMIWQTVAINPILQGTIDKKLSIYGKLVFCSEMINNFLGTIQLTSPLPGNFLTMNGQSIKGNLEFAGTGGWIVTDDLQCNGKLFQNAGTLDLENIQLTTVGGFYSDGSLLRRLIFNNSLVTINGDGLIINTDNLIIDKGQSEVNVLTQNTASTIKGSSTAHFHKLLFRNTNLSNSYIINIHYLLLYGSLDVDELTLSGGFINAQSYSTTSKIYAREIHFEGPGDKIIKQSITLKIDLLKSNSTFLNLFLETNIQDTIHRIELRNGHCYLSGGGLKNQFMDLECSTDIIGNYTTDSLLFYPGRSYILQAGAILTIQNHLRIRGNNCLPIQIRSSIQGTQAVITKNAGIVSGDFLELRDINATGGATFFAGNLSTDLGNNTGWDFLNSPNYYYGLGPDTTICSGQTLTTNNFNGAISYLWQDGSTLPFFIINQSGSYWVEATYGPNCHYRDTIVVQVKPTPLVSISELTPTVCKTEPFSLTSEVTLGLEPYQYKWYTSNNIPDTLLQTPIADTPSLTIDPSQLNWSTPYYLVSAKCSNGCIGTDTIQFLIPPPITITLATTSPSACGTSTGTINAVASGGIPYSSSQPYNYLWNTIPSMNTSNLSNLAAGSYRLTVTDSLGCQVDTTIILADPGTTTVDLNINSNIACSNEIITATASGFSLYEFFIDGASQGLPNNQSQLLITGFAPGEHNLYVIGTTGSCSSGSAIVPFTIISGETLTAHIESNPTPPVCMGETVNFTVLTTEGINGLNYQWIRNDIQITGATESTLSLIPNNLDRIKCEVITNQGCINNPSSTSNEIIVSVIDAPTIILYITVTPSTEICEDTPIIFNALTENTIGEPSYSWYLNGNLVLNSGNQYNLLHPNDGDEVFCRLYASDECGALKTLDSFPQIIKVNAKPTTSGIYLD